ncbi:MAG: radical SAM protein, partial [Deltaproteobacteria bacterium]|nr:radical SAM protein [Deltaproteobacteria bacterium]
LCEGIVKNVFIGDSDSLIMKTGDLKEILLFLYETFPHLEKVTSYARAKTLFKKGIEDLKALRKAGLTRLHVGLESGDDTILRSINKVATAEEMILAGQKALEAGFELSEYVMPGLGGQERWEQHARETARVLNRINPHFIRLRTLNLSMAPDTPLSDKAKRGEFNIQSLEGLVIEVRTLIEELNVLSEFVATDFAQNYYLMDVDGKLPEDKEKMLKSLDTAAEWIRSKRTI